MEIRILKYLIENNSKKFSIREISTNLKLDYKNTYNTIQKLKKENLINLKKIGQSSQIQFNFNFNEKILKIEILRKENLLKNKNLKLIQKKIDDLNYPFLIVLVFGSYVKKNKNKNSDIDLCVICDNKKIIKQLYEKLTILSLEIDLNEFTIDEFKSMLKTTEFNVGLEIKNNNIILKGIENYYNLIRNG